MTRTIGMNRSGHDLGPMRRSLSARVFACALLALLASSATAAAQTATQRTFAAPDDAVKALFDAVKAGNVDAMLAIFGPEGRELSRVVRSRDRSDEPPGVRCRGQGAVASRGCDAQSKDARRRLRGLALPGAARQRGGRMAIRHSGRQGRSAGAADRTQRAASDRDLPCLRHRAAALRATGTRRQARGRARDEVEERSRQRERPVLADRARPEAESTW